MALPVLFVLGVAIVVLSALVVIFRAPLSRWAGRLAARDPTVPKAMRQQSGRVEGRTAAMLWNAAVLMVIGSVFIKIGLTGP